MTTSAEVGDFEVFSIVENSFKIDGGALFGLVPKVIWRKLVEADEDNLIRLDCNVLLVRTPEANVLVDAGIGDTLTDKQRKIFGVEGQSRFESQMRQFGVAAGDVDVVIFSHLHFDHAGGALRFDDGKKVPRFTNARHVIQRSEWEDALRPNERTKATYLSDDLKLLEEYDLLELVDGESEIIPGVRVRRTGGHCRGHQMVTFHSQGKTLVCLGDILPTASHVRIPYIAAVDTLPLETLEVKKKLFPQILNERWIVALDHDVGIKLGHLEVRGGRVQVVELNR